MTTEIHQLQAQLTEALTRIQRLEDQMGSVQEAQRWKHLIVRPDSWRRQLSLRQRRMTVGQLVSTVRANRMTPEQAAVDLDLPVEAIQEALAYYEQHKELIQREAEEERRWLIEQGLMRDPENLPDDCANARGLVPLLREAGHEAATPADLGIPGVDDATHLAQAAALGLVVLTKNPRDFGRLHRADSNHAGILFVYQDNNPDRDMSYADIVRAIGKLQNAGIEIRGTCHSLNDRRY